MPAGDKAARRLAGPAISTYIPAMSETNLTHDEKTALAGLLRGTIAADRYPLSPRVGNPAAPMRPLYDSRIEDLGAGDCLRVECAAMTS